VDAESCCAGTAVSQHDRGVGQRSEGGREHHHGQGLWLPEADQYWNKQSRDDVRTARRERERTERHRLIIATARELAEAEGWDAVTTRRLAERVEYSQPVLCSHFANKEAILGAVALESFTEFADGLAAARQSASPGTSWLRS
jgi:hypothetical protein